MSECISLISDSRSGGRVAVFCGMALFFSTGTSLDWTMFSFSSHSLPYQNILRGLFNAPDLRGELLCGTSVLVVRPENPAEGRQCKLVFSFNLTT